MVVKVRTHRPLTGMRKHLVAFPNRKHVRRQAILIVSLPAKWKVRFRSSTLVPLPHGEGLMEAYQKERSIGIIISSGG